MSDLPPVPKTKARPLIYEEDGVIMHRDHNWKCTPARVVLRKERISVGCRDITPRAIRMILAAYDDRYSEAPECVVLQEGDPCDE